MARQQAITLDIHRYERKFRDAEATVQRSPLSDRNKELILRYRDVCLLKNVCGRVRLIRIMGALTVMGAILVKDFDQATKDDVERVVTALLARDPPYSAETLGSYKAILRSFLTWVVLPDEFPTRHYPSLVAWISCHVKARDKKRLARNELLTPEDIAAALRVARSPRNKALIGALWESGGRIAEIGNRQLKHITRHQYGYSLEVTGKTGMRSVLLVETAAYMTAWLNHHPFPNDPESPLWAHYQYETQVGYLKYDTIRNLLLETFARAGINKPCHPHIFRHSRATFLLAQGTLTEAQAKVYFGWSPDSTQLRTYSHLVDGDAHNAILRQHHLAPPPENHDALTPTACQLCGSLNPPNTVLCNNCGSVANPATGIKQASLVPDQAVETLLKNLVDHNPTEQAIQTIRDAGLGTTLARLAKQRDDAPNPTGDR